MTNKEITNIIKNSDSYEFLSNLTVELDFYHINFKAKFSSFLELYIFIKRQQKGWNKIKIELPNALNESKDYFDSFLIKLNELIESDDIIHNWKLIEEEYINFIEYTRYFKKNIFTFDSPKTSLLIDLFNIDRVVFFGGYDYLYGKIEKLKINNKLYLKGIIKAYEFEEQSPDKILKRSRFEKSSFSRLRNDFESFIINSNRTFSELFAEIDDLKAEKRKKFDSWFEKIRIQEKNRINTITTNEIAYNEERINRSKELEELYSEKLMLSKPAEFWDKRAKELKKESKKWLYSLLLATSISVSLLVFIIIKISNDTLVHLFSSVGSSIRWSILLISIISFLAFAIRIFSKLTLSSYHLARDAEERKQLVYVYLSLKNQKAISEQERILILQSIFSRSDTGLLKEDSAPTMPTSGIIEKIMTNK